MNDKRLHALPSMGSPIAEADLHAYADGQLATARARSRPSWPRIRRTAPAWTHGRRSARRCAPCSTRCWTSRCRCACRWRRRRAPPWRALAAGIAVAVFSGGAAWIARGELDHDRIRAALAAPRRARGSQLCAARRRGARGLRARHGRPVEVGGDNEKALVTWLTKRLGAPVSAPSLSALGYELVGGRLLPGGAGGGAVHVRRARRAAPDPVRHARGRRPDRLPVHAGRAGARVLGPRVRSATRCRAPSARKNCNGCRWKSTDSCRADIAPRVARGAVSGRARPAWTGLAAARLVQHAQRDLADFGPAHADVRAQQARASSARRASTALRMAPCSS